ncbi:MAG: beta-N-acetylhexosaminidase [Ruminococcaceae bacterium]|nr:beta-N-acetylhexosaminidase [Oscillospiraceae bacterium]
MSKNIVTLSFSVQEELYAPTKRLQALLGFTEGAGIEVLAVQDSRNGVVLKGGKAEIHYTKKPLFYRGLGLLVEHARGKKEFEIFEDGHFEELSVMIDTSRCAVPTVETVKRMLDHLAVMGYSMAMLYTEDTVELEGRPYFGYMRGRYTADELRAIDDYAYEYGIEIIPCLECYGHMARYLMWPEAKSIKDTSAVLLAREEETFRFLEQLIATVSGCLRSKRVHVGMDEAWDMGRGKFMDKHGFVPAPEIFNEYMERLISITRKYGLQVMMWSDMYFRASGLPYGGDPDRCTIPPEVVAKIPEGVELVYWHYGERPGSDDYMVRAHKETGHKTLYAGGLWSWIGHFPEHNYAMETIAQGLAACRHHDVREAMITIWSNDNAECDLFANLFGLSFFAELAFDQNADEEKRRARFSTCTGGDFDAFYEMSYYHNSFDDPAPFAEKYSKRFLGKPLFWQDILEGLYDTHLFERPMSGHYAACAARMQEVLRAREGDPWQYLYDFAYRVFDYLAIKTLIAENLVPAYKAGKREVLAEIAEKLLPLLREKTRAVHLAHKEMWFANNKIVGWCNLDVRYGGVVARCETAELLLRRYLEGKDSVIEPLEVERLPKKLSGFEHYSGIATPNGKT